MPDLVFHFPPELTQLLIDTIPRLCRSKKDVILFFRGAGVGPSVCSEIDQELSQNPGKLHKYAITRRFLVHVNELGERGLRQRREILKRVVGFDDFSRCWPNDQLEAKGLVAEIQRIVNVKDSFTRMANERNAERKRASDVYQAITAETARKREEREEIRKDLYSLFGMKDRSRRGSLLEVVLNRLFNHFGILIRESFRLTDDSSGQQIEQIDGVISLDSHVYLVEMKWLSKHVSVDDVSRHLVRVFTRGQSRGIFISSTEFTESSLKTCQEALQKTVVSLVTLEEIVELLESDSDLTEMLKWKVHSAQIEKSPFKRWRSDH